MVTGKVVAEGEQKGAHACFDVFVKDSTGKCAITVAVLGDLRDVQTSEIIEKEVDFKGTMKNNGKLGVPLAFSFVSLRHRRVGVRRLGMASRYSLQREQKSVF